jgi:hypothetical protein
MYFVLLEKFTGLFIGKWNLVNVIKPFLGSDIAWPKVIPLSGA